jgi:hypothetical protein
VTKRELKKALSLALAQIDRLERELDQRRGLVLLTRPYGEVVKTALAVLEEFGREAEPYPKIVDDSPINVTIPIREFRAAQLCVAEIRKSLQS